MTVRQLMISPHGNREEKSHKSFFYKSSSLVTHMGRHTWWVAECGVNIQIWTGSICVAEMGFKHQPSSTRVAQMDALLMRNSLTGHQCHCSSHHSSASQQRESGLLCECRICTVLILWCRLWPHHSLKGNSRRDPGVIMITFPLQESANRWTQAMSVAVISRWRPGLTRSQALLGL